MKKAVIIASLFVAFTMLLCSCAQESKGIGQTGISAEEFDQFSLGVMNYSEACSIIGGEGELISKTETAEDNRTRYVSVYRFEGEKSGYAELEFTVYGYKDVFEIDMNEYLTGKKQYDLK